MTTPNPSRPRAMLVGIQFPTVSDTEHEASLAELGRLVSTLGYDVCGIISQRRESLAPSAVLGAGKLRELADYTEGTGIVPGYAPDRISKARERFIASTTGQQASVPDADEPEDAGEPEDADELEDADALECADPSLASETAELPGGVSETGLRSFFIEGEPPSLVVVDHEISPSQARNLERATGVEVLDRTGVIVDIFHRHAQSREAKLQVEIARLKYVAPRMRESVGRKERQQGKGAGESALELDRRKIRDRIKELKEELDAILAQQAGRRQSRKDQLRVALVGYTNAGKSSLMRALTGSDVLVADKLFATLDTTVRALYPETKPRLLVSDTVGFIKKLPHDLVASFRSTLDEALEASLLLYVMDVSDPTCDEQLEVTRSVLREIGADTAPFLLILNKADRVTQNQLTQALERYPAGIALSAKSEADVAMLRGRIVSHFEGATVEQTLVVSYGKQHKIGEIYESAKVVSESYDEQGATLVIRALPAVASRLVQLFG